MMRPLPKIVVLDGYTLNPGDLPWNSLRELGECTIHDRTKAQDIVPRARDATVVLTNKVPLSGETIKELHQLRYIGVLATGYNVVDVAAAKARSVVVTNVPSYGTQSVAQTVFAHLLNFTQHVADHSTAVKAGRWKANPDWCFWDQPLIELAQLNMGLIGLGRIGSCVAALANAFGMHVYASTPNPKSVPDFVQIVGLRDVFSVSDVISLHCPLTAETKHLVNGDMLSLMKPTALLINTSRGPLIDEHALAHALNSGQIAGAGLDVLSVEPPIEHNVLLTAKNCQITPHFAWATHAARKRLLQIAVGNIVAFLGGAPCNVVN